MKITLWGTRGSIASPGPETVRYGGNTACVGLVGADGTVIALDAGTGIRRLGAAVPADVRRVDVLLTHLHMDHIQGLGFFAPLFRPGLEVHIWGPDSTTLDLRARLKRYLSPPLFPVHLHDLPCNLHLHDAVSAGEFRIGGLEVKADLVCHPGPTVGYRITENDKSVAYLPDHEPALACSGIGGDPEWMSGYDLSAGVDLLIHDSQYTPEEYVRCTGWGHSTLEDACEFAAFVGIGRLVPFHHDPTRSDDALDRAFERLVARPDRKFEVGKGMEGAVFEIGE
jgi:phosphoribosyl 1,2-cyclic phosphodiesterase